VSRLDGIVAVVAVLAALDAMADVALRGAHAQVPGFPTGSDPPALPTAGMPVGGVHAGMVVGRAGEPVTGATVLLASDDSGDGARREKAFRLVAGGRTDDAGRFRVVAETPSVVRFVVAYREGSALVFVPVEGPREDLRLLLSPGPGETTGPRGSR
jgi:hypothetical protein